MQNTTSRDTVREFFAAANGYSGFRSYFDRVFPSEEFERIFILKGGPGTGKSSLLRALLSFGEESGMEREAILCSSDPHSLDGVILSKEKKHFAALDGTAPHVRDANIPGATDVLVNLGENWDSGVLESNRGIITELNRRKRENYSLAYKHLALAGRIKAVESELEAMQINANLIESDTKNLAEDLMISERKGRENVRLVHSFGRFGTYGLETLEHISKRIIRIGKPCFAAYKFTSNLQKILRGAHVAMTVFPSVFDADMIEAVHLPESKTTVMIGDAVDPDYNTEKYVIKSGSIQASKTVSDAYGTLLDEAKKFFTFASDIHFELEKIYIGAMDFSANRVMTEKIIEKIKKATE